MHGMFDRRGIIVASIAAASAFGLAACGKLDVAQVAAAIKAACSLLVPAAVIADMVQQDSSLTMSQIVDLVCGAYKTALASRAANKLGAPASGSKIELVVVVKGKAIPFEATVL